MSLYFTNRPNPGAPSLLLLLTLALLIPFTPPNPSHLLQLPLLLGASTPHRLCTPLLHFTFLAGILSIYSSITPLAAWSLAASVGLYARMFPAGTSRSVVAKLLLYLALNARLREGWEITGINCDFTEGWCNVRAGAWQRITVWAAVTAVRFWWFGP